MVKCEMQESLILCCWGSKCILITAVKLWINQFVKSFPLKNPLDSPRIMHGLDTTDTMYHLFYSLSSGCPDPAADARFYRILNMMMMMVMMMVICHRIVRK